MTTDFSDLTSLLDKLNINDTGLVKKQKKKKIDVCDDILYELIAFLKFRAVARVSYVNRRFHKIAEARRDVLSPLVAPLYFSGNMIMKYVGTNKVLRLPTTEPPKNIHFERISIKDSIGNDTMEFIQLVSPNLVGASVEFCDPTNFFQDFGEVADMFVEFFYGCGEIRFWALSIEEPILNRAVLYCNNLFVHCGREFADFKPVIDWLHYDGGDGGSRSMTIVLHRSKTKFDILEFVDRIFEKFNQSTIALHRFVLKIRTHYLAEPVIGTTITKYNNVTQERLSLTPITGQQKYILKRESIVKSDAGNRTDPRRTQIVIERIEKPPMPSAKM